MRLIHFSPHDTWISIRRQGLLLKYSQGKIPGTWAVTKSRWAYGFNHARHRHPVPSGLYDAYVIDVPRSWCRRFSKGVWIVKRDIPPSRILAYHEMSQPRF